MGPGRRQASLAIINMKGLFPAARYTLGSSGHSLNLNLGGRGPNIPRVYGGRQDTELTTIHFTGVAKALLKLGRCLYCITRTGGASPGATINFPETQNHCQPSEPQTNVRLQGWRRGRSAGTRDTHLSPPLALRPQDGCCSQSRAAPLTSKKSYREPRSCQKLFPGDFDQLML